MYEDGYTKSRSLAPFSLTASGARLGHSAAALGKRGPSGTHGSPGAWSGTTRSKIISRPAIACPGRSPYAQKPGCRVASAEGGLTMSIQSLAAHHVSELDRLGDEIAEL